MHRTVAKALLPLLPAMALGCELGPPTASYRPNPGSPILQATLPNPVLVPVANRDQTWDGIVDVVDDYFKIEREVRPRVVGDVLTDGRIDTFARSGSTYFEPWNNDAANAYERLEGTLQSIRRRAFIAVHPDQNGYLIDVSVMKELEDLERPEHATTGAATFRYDNSIEQSNGSQFGTSGENGGGPRELGDRPRPVGDQTFTAGWIPIGRDAALEQQIIAQLQLRLGGALQAQPAPAYGAPQVGSQPY